MKNIILLICSVVLLSGCATSNSALQKRCMAECYSRGIITKTQLIQCYERIDNPDYSENRPNILSQEQFDKMKEVAMEMEQQQQFTQRFVQGFFVGLGNGLNNLQQQKQQQQQWISQPGLKTTTTHGTIIPTGGGYYQYDEQTTSY